MWFGDVQNDTTIGPTFLGDWRRSLVKKLSLCPKLGILGISEFKFPKNVNTLILKLGSIARYLIARLWIKPSPSHEMCFKSVNGKGYYDKRLPV